MENSIYIGLSKQMALQNNMTLISNNIANMNTNGYRGQSMLFEEYIADPRGADDPLSFVYDKGQYQNTTSGPLKYTGNALDVAVVGSGYIGIQGPNGLAYTRDGRFQIDANGTLVNASGLPVADAGGALIVLPPSITAETTQVTIDEKGFIYDRNGQLGQIMLVEFENEQALEPKGNNLYTSREEPQPALESRIKQRQLEGSNVNPIMEMTRMIDTLRSYQSIQRTLQGENDRLRSAIQKLTGQG